ncbi:MAG TPA: NADH-quinone oxidoreductase subunit N [Candidatus Margulisiibacteriota bacterium]|nr:NADH-quinone oxidoreductase subunit N [Candidatus Margulisiibacteriota bacterium]
MIPAPNISYVALLPVLILTGTALLALIADLWMEGPDREGLGWIGLVGLLATAITALTLWSTHISTLSDALVVDRYGLFFTLLFCVVSGLTLLMSMSYLEATEIKTGDYYSLVLFSTVGMVLMSTATDLIVIFLGLEVMSIAAYALAGLARSELRSNEAALKYFLLGAFASGFLLFGIALLYGATGTTTLPQIAQRLTTLAGEQRLLVTAGMALLIVGFGFKVAAVPFHVWAPDVYEGSPTSVTALMAVGIKAAAFAAFARVFMHTLVIFRADWAGVLWVLAVLTMTVGNVTALVQRNIKRMLAYSSVAHAGYLLVGMVAGGEAGGSAVLFYLIAYAFMTLGAFAVVIALGHRGQANENLDDYAGVGFRSPFLGAAMAVFMLSLSGIPPLAGFVGKFYIFSAAVKAGYTGLAIIGVLNSVVSVYYYVGVLVRMYMTEGTTEVAAPSSRPYLFATLLLTVTGTVLLGLFPSSLFEVARQSFLALH